jgi:hypothetical protein
MAYRNKTFVSFASENIAYYRLMQAWKANDRIDFDFYDAHDLNTALDTSQPQTIERRLSERLANTKQVVMLIGDVTRQKAGDGVSFVHHEVSVIKRLKIPIVFANLNQCRTVESSRLPAALADLYTISVSFQPKIIMHALDDFIDGYAANSLTKKGPHHYVAAEYARLGL